jgi:hypothetical protein
MRLLKPNPSTIWSTHIKIKTLSNHQPRRHGHVSKNHYIWLSPHHKNMPKIGQIVWFG